LLDHSVNLVMKYVKEAKCVDIKPSFWENLKSFLK
jgi:hypothetical protein